MVLAVSAITHEQMLEALLEEKRLADRRAEEARLHAVRARDEAQRLEGAVAAIQALMPPAAPAGPPIDFGPDILAGAMIPTWAGNPFASDPPGAVDQDEADEDETSDRKRVPSTEWAAEIVLDAGRAMSREEVQDEFARRHGIPTSWADPVASINVALKRASLKGMITRTGRATYAPPGQTTDVASEELVMAE